MTTAHTANVPECAPDFSSFGEFEETMARISQHLNNLNRQSPELWHILSCGAGVIGVELLFRPDGTNTPVPILSEPFEAPDDHSNGFIEVRIVDPDDRAHLYAYGLFRKRGPLIAPLSIGILEEGNPDFIEELCEEIVLMAKKPFADELDDIEGFRDLRPD